MSCQNVAYSSVHFTSDNHCLTKAQNWNFNLQLCCLSPHRGPAKVGPYIIKVGSQAELEN